MACWTAVRMSLLSAGIRTNGSSLRCIAVCPGLPSAPSPGWQQQQPSIRTAAGRARPPAGAASRRSKRSTSRVWSAAAAAGGSRGDSKMAVEMMAAKPQAGEGAAVAAAAADQEGAVEEEEGIEEEEGYGQPTHFIIKDGFSPVVDQLREHFDSRFADPRTFEGRFVWDYWHVPNQYTLVRTPANQYFPKPLYKELESALLEYGITRLGCRSMSPVWLSYYVEGCRQELHTDSPHGPWAFVLSLTDWRQRRFSGGQTQLLKPEVLDYWRGFQGYGQERDSLVDLIEPEFNRLTVFDPRLPHGVVPIHGVHDPREARIVLHGWFAEPEPFFEGGLPEEEAVDAVNELMGSLLPDLAQLPEAMGTVVVRFTIGGSSGRATGFELLTDTLVPRPPRVGGGGWAAVAAAGEQGEGGEEGSAEGGPSAVRDALLDAVFDGLASHEFPRSSTGQDTQVTLPLLF